MKLPHLRHHWELVETATPGVFSRRCPTCGKYKLAPTLPGHAHRTMRTKTMGVVPYGRK